MEAFAQQAPATQPALSAFASWGQKASVRLPDVTGVLPPWRDEFDLYNPALSPYTSHPSVAKFGRRTQQILGARRLADYLTRTEAVEVHIVNPAVLAILNLPATDESARSDLLKIYTDEGYHALVMVDFRKCISQTSGIELPRRAQHSVDAILRRIGRMPPELRAEGLICAAIVTETLITSTLRQAAARDSVYSPVRAMLAAHAADETRHHAFFTRFAQGFFPSLCPDDAQALEALLADMMWDFLSPDWQLLVADLMAVGLDATTATQVLLESYRAEALREQFLHASVATRRLLSRLSPLSVELFESRVEACCASGLSEFFNS